MSIPANLPENLVSIRDAAIDFAMGRSKSEPENVNELYEWLEVESYDDFMIVGDGFYTHVITSSFNDEELSDDEGVGKEVITDELRVAYAKRKVSECNSPDSINVLIVMFMLIQNTNNEKAFLGLIQEEHGMHDLGVSWWGIYKSEADFIEELTNSDIFMFLGEEEALTDNEILKLWNS
jgi:hypothetical protein